MSHVLLLGAGFSYNWGGWLAAEVNDYLFTTSHIKKDVHLQKTLRRATSGGGYEAALAEVQNDYTLNGTQDHLEHLKNLQAAIAEMFMAMEQGFASKPSMEFSTNADMQVWKFLAKFDAIFTLNQDLLLERHYLDDNLCTALPHKWDGWRMPGMRVLSNLNSGTPHECANIKWTPDASTPFRTEGNIQPYFKLHGSWNWFSTSGEPMLIMGSNKLSSIQRHPILNWYQQQFESYLSLPNTRLMVIGYSFGDQHINESIYNAWTKHLTLSMFIIHPKGWGAITDKRPGRILRYAHQLEDVGNAGASTRSLSQTFGEDVAEHRKVMKFFDP